MLVSGKKKKTNKQTKKNKKTKNLDLDLVERDFCSARQAYAHAQQEEVTEERDLRPNSQEVS